MKTANHAPVHRLCGMILLMLPGAVPAATTVCFRETFETHPRGDWTLPATPDLGYQWTAYSTAGNYTNRIHGDVVRGGTNALAMIRPTAGDNHILRGQASAMVLLPDHDLTFSFDFKRSAVGDDTAIYFTHTFSFSAGDIAGVYMSADGLYQYRMCEIDNWGTLTRLASGDWDHFDVVLHLVADPSNAANVTGKADYWLTSPVTGGWRTRVATDVPVPSFPANAPLNIGVFPAEGVSTWDNFEIRMAPSTPVNTSVMFRETFETQPRGEIPDKSTPAIGDRWQWPTAPVNRAITNQGDHVFSGTNAMAIFRDPVSGAGILGGYSSRSILLEGHSRLIFKMKFKRSATASTDTSVFLSRSSAHTDSIAGWYMSTAGVYSYWNDTDNTWRNTGCANSGATQWDLLELDLRLLESGAKLKGRWDLWLTAPADTGTRTRIASNIPILDFTIPGQMAFLIFPMKGVSYFDDFDMTLEPIPTGTCVVLR